MAVSTGQELRQRKVAKEQQESAATDITHDTDDKKSPSHRTGQWQSEPLALLKDGIIVILLLVWAAPVRLQSIDQPAEVVFDEVHFGTFAGKYIRREFFFDVHPPLAKMIIALVAKLFGYDGSFDFGAIGNPYTDDVPYVQMRTLSACLGVLVVPMAYLTLRAGGHSLSAALVAAVAVCYENSLVTNNRFILLDSFLLFFTAWAVMWWSIFFSERARPFQKKWWAALALTGVGLGCAVSCKWVGLFTIATIGLSTVNDLWRLWGDLTVSKTAWTRHFGARALCLIVLPVAIYIGTFCLHFLSVPRSGDGDAHMSAAFQHSLIGRSVPDSPIDIAYGSRVTVRHLATSGGYLHSHLAGYPEGSQQQQVTLYPFRDENNWWIIRKENNTLDMDNSEGDVLGKDNETWLQWVRHGDIVRLEHVTTSPRRLHSHDVKAPITDTDYHKEVSGYGFPDHDGDANDYWRVEIEQDDDSEEPVKLQTLKSRFRLVHLLQNCALYSHSARLPDWGYGQQEVSCIQNGRKPKTLWMIEEVQHDLLPDTVPMVNYTPMSFWSKFVELNKVMWRVNSELTGSHPYESRPLGWPVLVSGISYWAKELEHIYLLGNPAVYWATTIALFNFAILFSFFKIRSQRGYHDDYNGRRSVYESAGSFFAMGWACHYFPFFVMGRQLFSHHYQPALYFAILLFGVGVDLAMTRMSWRGRLFAFVLFAVIFTQTFRIFEPVTYGKPWDLESCEASRWLPTWTFGCERYNLSLVDGETSANNEPASPWTPIEQPSISSSGTFANDQVEWPE